MACSRNIKGVNVDNLSTRRGPGPAGLVVAAFSLLAFSGPAAGDTVHCVSAESYKHVRVVGFDNAKLEFLDRSGKRTTVRWDQVAAIRLDGHEQLNRAEQYLVADQYEAAGRYYRRALERTKRGWVRAWIDSRLVNVSARQGQAAAMAEAYCRLADSHPRWAIQVTADVEVPSRAGDRWAEAVSILEAQEKRQSRAAVREALRKFRVRLQRALGQAGRSDAAELRSQRNEGLPVQAGAKGPPPLRGTAFDRWASECLKAGESEKVFSAVRQRLGEAHGADLPQLLYWRGRAHHAAGDFESAALDYLRVAIEFPGSREAPLGLFHAARCLRRTGQAKAGRRLLEELARRYGGRTDAETARVVQAARAAAQR